MKAKTKRKKPFKNQVWLHGKHVGTYSFKTAKKADADYEERKGFEVLGFVYRLIRP